MKKTLCLILVLLMCVAVSTCGKADVKEDIPPVTDDTADTNDVQDNGEEEKDEEPEIDPKTIWNGTLEHPDTVGFFDPDYDYSANPRYKVCFFADGTSSFLEKYNEVFSHWCGKMNVQYDGIILSEYDESENDLEIVANEYDGVILYCQWTHKAAAYAEILNNSSCSWMTIGELRDCDDKSNPVLRPYLSYGDFGISQGVSYMKDYISENWTDADISEIGIFYLTYGGLNPIEQREEMFVNEIKAQMPEFSDNIVSLNMNLEYASFEDAYSKVIEENPQYKYWLCVPFTDFSSRNLSLALENNGLAEKAAVYCIYDAYEIWHINGYELYKAVTTVPLVMELEPIVGALYAFMNGDTTPETIWGGDENGYGACDFNGVYLVTKENYKDFLGKVNEYAGGEFYVID